MGVQYIHIMSKLIMSSSKKKRENCVRFRKFTYNLLWITYSSKLLAAWLIYYSVARTKIYWVAYELALAAFTSAALRTATMLLSKFHKFSKCDHFSQTLLMHILQCIRYARTLWLCVYRPYFCCSSPWTSFKYHPNKKMRIGLNPVFYYKYYFK